MVILSLALYVFNMKHEIKMIQYVARIISSQKMYGLYALKHHIVEMRGDVTDAGQTNNERTTTEDGATQPMEAGG